MRLAGVDDDEPTPEVDVRGGYLADPDGVPVVGKEHWAIGATDLVSMTDPFDRPATAVSLALHGLQLWRTNRLRFILSQRRIRPAGGRATRGSPALPCCWTSTVRVTQETAPWTGAWNAQSAPLSLLTSTAAELGEKTDPGIRPRHHVLDPRLPSAVAASRLAVGR